MWNYFLKFVWEDGQRTAMSAGPTPSIRPSDTAMTVATATDDPTVHHDIIYQWMKLPQMRVNVTSAWTEEPTHTSVVTLNYLSDPKSNSWAKIMCLNELMTIRGPNRKCMGSVESSLLTETERDVLRYYIPPTTGLHNKSICLSIGMALSPWATVTSQVTQSKIRQIKLQLFSCLIQEENVLIFH